MIKTHSLQLIQGILVSLIITAALLPATGFAKDNADEELYRKLSGIAIGSGDSSLIDRLNTHSE